MQTIQNQSNIINSHNFDKIEIDLFDRIKSLCFEKDEPYFMINYKAGFDEKCFLTTEDINRHKHNGCLIFPRTFCRMLRYSADSSLSERLEIKKHILTLLGNLKQEVIQKFAIFEHFIKQKFLRKNSPYHFFKKFCNGKYKENDDLIKDLEEMIRNCDIYEGIQQTNSIQKKLELIEKEFQTALTSSELFINKNFIEKNQQYSSSDQKHFKKSVLFPEYSTHSQNKILLTPTSFQQLNHVIINQGKSIPHTNGIDVHPTKNIYVALGCDGGDLVILSQNLKKELNRIPLKNNNNNGYLLAQNCLWNPAGTKIMVSTFQNHSIFIFDDKTQNLIMSIEKTFTEHGYGAIWLSDRDVCVGYRNGALKFFNIEIGNEIGNMQLNSSYAWGMECLDDSHLLVGDSGGSIYNANIKKQSFEWVLTEWHSYWIRCLKLNKNKTLLLTGSGDNYVKLMEVKNQSKIWEFKLNNVVQGLCWAPEDAYILALSSHNQLVALDPKKGNKLLEFNELSTKSMSMKLNPRTYEILVGDQQGGITRLQIEHK